MKIIFGNGAKSVFFYVRCLPSALVRNSLRAVKNTIVFELKPQDEHVKPLSHKHCDLLITNYSVKIGIRKLQRWR